VRKAHIRDEPDPATKNRRVERLMLRTVEILASQILKGLRAEAEESETVPRKYTDDDRLRALITFIERLKVTNPPGVLAIRRVLFDDLA
jgi:hypothetical protein